jgi:hypothetical protein
MRGIGKIDTTTLLLIGGGVVAAYVLTRPATPTYPVGYNPYATNTGLTALQQQQYLAQQNPTSSIIASSGSALEGLSDLIGNFF